MSNIQNAEVDADDVPSLDELTDDDISDLLTSVEIETPDSEQTALAEVAADLVVAHNQIEGYKDGSLALSQAIDEAIIEHEADENAEVVEILGELKRTAFGVYLRVRRGDDELLGDREGKYSDYFADEAEEGS